MKNGEIIFEYFESLETLEPSEEWNTKLLQKLAHSKRVSVKGVTNYLIIVLMLVIMSLNVYAVSGSLISYRQKQNTMTLKNIASEILISTDSSKY